MLYNSIKKDKKLKSNLIVLDDYLGSKLDGLIILKILILL